MQFSEGMSRDAFGCVVIRSKIKSPTGRLDYEKKLFWPSVEVGLKGGSERIVKATLQVAKAHTEFAMPLVRLISVFTAVPGLFLQVIES